MKTISVRQPWAWARIHGEKRVENRSRATRYRGPLAIHAGLSRSWLETAWLALDRLPPESQLSFGAVIGIVDLLDCVRFAELDARRRDIGDSIFAAGPWCWIMANPRALAKPIPLRGRLGFFESPVTEPVTESAEFLRPRD